MRSVEEKGEVMMMMRGAQHIYPIAYISSSNPITVTSILSYSPVLKIFQQR